MAPWHVTAFYCFREVPDPAALRLELLALEEIFAMKALIILAREGINGTAAFRDEDGRRGFQDWLRERFGKNLSFKDSSSAATPFRRMVVKIRPEIVTLKRPDLRPQGPRRHLGPRAWDEAIARGAVLLDTRNRFESRIGTFRGAVTPEISRFEEFPEAVRRSNLPKDAPILIFCTGGIRCEKAILSLEEMGYSDVSQLDGGILRYLEETGGGSWEGECFVFDGRVAVTKELQPSGRYTLCAKCGNPSESPTCGLCSQS